MPKTVYTAICGSYDRLRPIPERFRKGWEAYCFTDGDISTVPGWKIVHVQRGNLLPVAFSKKIKILTEGFLPGADPTLWIDASLSVIASLDEYVNGFLQEDMVLIRHPERDCVYEEMEACVRLHKADPKRIEFQKKAYMNMNFPPHRGLFKAGILFRKSSYRVASLNRIWWAYTLRYATWRDQLTLPLALHLMHWNPRQIDDSVSRGVFKQVAVHRERKEK